MGRAMESEKRIAMLCGLSVFMCTVGCDAVPAASLHASLEWNAKDFFKDPQVIQLCAAIEKSDLKEIDRLVAAGANVNAKGKDGMTPLLWAYPDNKLERFEKLLALGANPDVAVSSDFGTKGMIRPGTSVTHLAAGTKFPGYFEAVIKHGGDPELLNAWGKSPLRVVIGTPMPRELKKKRVMLLIEKNVKLDEFGEFNSTPTMLAIGGTGQYDIALLLLEAGASPTICRPDSNNRLVHSVVGRQMLRQDMLRRAAARGQAIATSEKNTNLEKKIIQILEASGEDLAEAKKDLERWMEWGKVYSPEKYKELMMQEVAARAAEQKKKLD